MNDPNDDYHRLLVLSITRDDEEITDGHYIGTGDSSKVYAVKPSLSCLLICQVRYKQPDSQV